MKVELAYVDQGYTGEAAAADAAQHGVTLDVVKLGAARRGFVMPPRRWVVERSFACLMLGGVVHLFLGSS